MEIPIVSSEATRVALRPTRSPKWPKTAEPIGRAIKAIAKVASDCSVAAAGSPCREENVREYDNRRGGIDEVEELDGGTNE